MPDGCGTVPIKVLCRVRPLNAAECHTEFLPTLYDNGTSLSLSGKPYTFDKVFGPDSTQSEVYRDGVSAIVEDVLSGYNGTIFAYGQTSSGKTHTMEGSLHGGRDNEQSGITPRVVLDVFRHIKKLPPHIQASLKVSYFEVYMEKVRDLLDVSKVNLPVHEDKNKVPYVKGVTEVDVFSLDEVFDIMDEGMSNRSVAVTNMNEHSSRSHSVFVLQVKQSDIQSEKTLHGKLYLVDLAGSEKVNKTGSEGVTLKEATKINKSLSALGNVILALADGNKNHVPYRDSKLTRILQQSLGGNSRTSIFICCSPSAVNESETKSSLMFGQRAKTIKNEIMVNEELTAEEWKRRFEKEKENNVKLRTRLAQYELGTLPKDHSPDVIPQSQSSTSCTLPAAAVAPMLTTHASLPCLLPHSIPELSESCQECLKYQQDISKLYQQLDERDDEMGERSREILELESSVRDKNETIETLEQNNALLLSNYREMEHNHTEAKNEVKDVLAALEELADTYNISQMDSAGHIREICEKNRIISEFEEELQRTKRELGVVKVRLDQSKKQTLDMFLDIFNDFSHVSSPNRLRPSSDLYKSSPNLNVMTSSYPSSIGSSMSAHSGLSKHCDSEMTHSTSGSAMTNSLHSISTTDLSLSPVSPTEPGQTVLSQNMYNPITTSENLTSSEYQGSRGFQEKVGELRSRLSTLLESNYDKIISPADATSSYMRNVRLRKMRPRTGGRVFTVFSRTTRRNPLTDNIVPVQLGKAD